MKDQLVINDGVVVEFEVPGRLGDLVKDVDLGFEVQTEAQLRTVADLLGGIEHLRGDGRLLSYRADPEAFSNPRTVGGIPVAVNVWLTGEVAEKPRPDPPSALTRLRDERAAEVAERKAAAHAALEDLGSGELAQAAGA